MIKRFLLLSIFSLAFVSAGFANEVKKESLNLFLKNYDLELYKNDKWAFMANEFCYSWNNDEKELKTLDDIYSSLLAGGFCGAFVSMFLSSLLGNSRNLDPLETSLVECRNAIGLFIGTFVAIIVYKSRGQVTGNDYKNWLTLRCFLANWPKYKQLAPEELHEFFDSLYVYNKSGAIVEGDFVTELVEKIKRLVLTKIKHTEKCIN